MRHTKRAAFIVLSCCATLAGACSANSGNSRNGQSAAELKFGVDMARRGLWSEALFRFHEAELSDPQNPHVQNNLGVAYEASGNFDRALEHYKRALQLSPNNREVRSNYARFVEFYQSFKGPEKGAKPTAFGKLKSAPAGTPPPASGQPTGRRGNPPEEPGGAARPPGSPTDFPPPPGSPPPAANPPPQVPPPAAAIGGMDGIRRGAGPL